MRRYATSLRKIIIIDTNVFLVAIFRVFGFKLNFNELCVNSKLGKFLHRRPVLEYDMVLIRVCFLFGDKLKRVCFIPDCFTCSART